MARDKFTKGRLRARNAYADQAKRRTGGGPHRVQSKVPTAREALDEAEQELNADIKEADDVLRDADLEVDDLVEKLKGLNAVLRAAFPDEDS